MAKEKHTVCPECEQRYDIYLSRCPNCHHANDNRPLTRMCYLPIPYQLTLFLIGLIGLNVLATVIALFVSSLYKDHPEISSLIINGSTYAAIIIVDIVLIWKFFPELFSSFKNWRTYIAGFVSMAFLIGGSMLINYLMVLLVPSAGTGGNQSVAEKMVLANPFISLLILGLVGPLVEELTYRIGLFSLCKRVHIIFAYIITTLVFAAIHINFTATDFISELVVLPDYLFAGIMFCLIYDREGFGAGLIAHTGNNIFSILLILLKARMQNG